ncbi:MAG: radical SAM protein [Candidatus Moranbacteria bacterium RBG_19FT_COMBO_42_6]|nr:MAG: radical SAM protein [Candidatus Moranbacteria bacterium RBG_19FT_COMBO_42_6]
MFSLLPKIPLYKSFRKFGLPKMLPMNLTLNVTYRCNSRCRTCNVWKKKANELTLSEWEKIFRSIGPGKVFWLILSGGEPFLKPDLAQLCRLAAKYLEPKIINIPTNGYLYQIIPSRVEEILAAAPKSKVVINFSLDGVGEAHDKIRNLEGNFENLLKSFRAVQEINHTYRQAGNPRLTIGVHSVISKLNYDKVPEIYDFVQEELRPDSYITEIAEKRVELDNFSLDVFPDDEQYRKAIDFLPEKMAEEKNKGLSRVTRSLRKNYYQLVKDILKKKTQVIPCFAGFASAQVSAEGEVWPCCVRAGNMGHLRENDYDFQKVWSSEKSQAIRQSIKGKVCWCPLASASYTNMLMRSPSLLRIIKNYFF